MFLSWLFGRKKKKAADVREAEVKILNIREADIKDALIAQGAQKVFEGKIVTTWFKKSPLERINTRIRVTTGADGNRRFVWTIKTNPPGDDKTSLLSNKLKRQGEATSFGNARKALVKELQSFGVIVAPLFLTSKLTVEKNRVSYTCESGVCAGLQFDFDVLTAVDGEPLEPELPLMEIEDVSDRTAKEKEEKIRACADALGITIDENFSSLSTRKLLKKLGYR
jgi:hypothetical protein